MMAAAEKKIKVNITCLGQPLEQIETFLYLGSPITDDNDCISEIRTRLDLCCAAIKLLTNLQKGRLLSLLMKKRLKRLMKTSLAHCNAWSRILDVEENRPEENHSFRYDGLHKNDSYHLKRTQSKCLSYGRTWREQKYQYILGDPISGVARQRAKKSATSEKIQQPKKAITTS